MSAANQIALRSPDAQQFGGPMVPAAPRGVEPAELVNPGGGIASNLPDASPFVIVGAGDERQLGYQPRFTDRIAAAYCVYDRVPEVRAHVRRSAAVISRCAFRAVQTVDTPNGPDEVLAFDPDVIETEQQWLPWSGSPTVMPKLWAKHAIIAGRVWIAGMPRKDDPTRWAWQLIPAHRLRPSRQRPTTHLELYRKGRWHEVDRDLIYLSEWVDEDPGDPDGSDSPVIGIADCAMQLLVLDDLIKAVATSHLNYGIVKMSIEALTGKPAGEVDKVEAKQVATAFRKEITRHLTAWDADDGELYAGPMVVLGAADYLNQAAMHESIRLEFNDMLTDLQKMYVERLARGMDGPPEQMLGKGELTQWGSYNSDADQNENTHHPLAREYAWHVTTAVMRRWLCVAYQWSPEAAADVRYDCDTADLKARQDLSRSAQQVYDRVPLKPERLAELNGLDAGDVCTETEDRRHWRIEWLIKRAPVKYARLITLLPEFVDIADEVEELLITAAAEQPGGSPDVGVPGDTDDTPGTDDAPDRRTGEEPDPQASIVDVADMVAGLLESAGFDVDDLVDALA